MVTPKSKVEHTAKDNQIPMYSRESISFPGDMYMYVPYHVPGYGWPALPPF